jgi:D-aminoacyl-tRNA deacylase
VLPCCGKEKRVKVKYTNDKVQNPKFNTKRSALGTQDLALIAKVEGNKQKCGVEKDKEKMRAVIQRVSRAQVHAGGKIAGEIGKGLLILLGVGKGDTKKEADFLLEKIIHLRIFEDPQGKMNLSLMDCGGELLIVSQFTLYADCQKGRRPSFTDAGSPEEAKSIYEYFVAQARDCKIRVATGIFQASMEVELVNSGPVTIILDTPRNI